jgi:hypothetical protein
MAHPVRILRLNHVQLTIPKGMEMSEVAKPDALVGRGGFWLQLSGFQVHIGTEDGVEWRTSKRYRGRHSHSRHAALRVP